MVSQKVQKLAIRLHNIKKLQRAPASVEPFLRKRPYFDMVCQPVHGANPRGEWNWPEMVNLEDLHPQSN